MKIFKQILEKKLENFNNYDLKKWYPKAFWQFYSAFTLSVCILRLNGFEVKLDKSDVKKRNSLYKKILLSNKMSDVQLGKMHNFIKKDMDVIILALEFIDKLKDESSSYVGYFNKDDFIGILASEIEVLQ